MKIRKKTPLIPCNIVMKIYSKDAENNIELSSLTQNFLQQYKDINTYKLIKDKNNDFEMAFSPASLNIYINLLKSFIIQGELFNEHDSYKSMPVQAKMYFQNIDSDNYELLDEILLSDFGEIVLSDSFFNVTKLINELLFFKLNDDISNLKADELYEEKSDIAKSCIDTFIFEYKNINNKDFKPNLIATIPSLSEFENQDTNSVYIPAFQTTEEEKQKQIEEDKKQEEDRERKEKDDLNNKDINAENKHSQNDVDNNDSHSTDESQQIKAYKASFVKKSNDNTDDMPFIPKELYKSLKTITPRYLFEINKKDKDYGDINEAIQYGRFDAQRYIVNANNDFKIDANNFIKKTVNDINYDAKIQITNLVDEYNKDIQDAHNKFDVMLNDNTDIKKSANVFHTNNWKNSRYPKLIAERDRLIKYKTRKIQEKAKSDIEQMKQEVLADYENKLSNAQKSAVSQVETIYNEKMSFKAKRKDEELKAVKERLTNNLKNNIQSVLNKRQVTADNATFNIYHEFKKQLSKRQAPLVDEVVNLMERQTRLNNSSKKLYEIKSKDDENFIDKVSNHEEFKKEQNSNQDLDNEDTEDSKSNVNEKQSESSNSVEKPTKSKADRIREMQRKDVY